MQETSDLAAEQEALNQPDRQETSPQPDSAFTFEGNWREFAHIVFTDLLLSIVTLGIYRFWGTARERRYLWSHSRFVDEHLEWTGTGKELFIGFLLVMVLFALPLFVMAQVAQAMALQGNMVIAGLLGLLSSITIFYLGGLAKYRALRYRLSRTRWRGIRGGSNDPGYGYGLSYMGKTLLGILPLGLMIPWSMTSLWNERWNRLSFGSYSFTANADWNRVFKRFLLFYLAPLLIFLGGVAAAAITGGIGYLFGGEDGALGGLVMTIIALLLFFYLGLGLIAVAFYAQFYREVIGATRWNNVEFSFEASTKDWVKLLLGDVALVVLTLGIGSIFLSYRHWKFFIVNLEARGEIQLDTLTQSTTQTDGFGEGLIEVFDIGAI